MKFLTFFFATFFTLSTLAIENSKLAPRHQVVIKKAVTSQCSLRLTDIQELATQATPIRIDQGILDYQYVTTLIAVDKIDQGITDHYKVTVHSHYSDAYDHEAKDWGIYRVNAVECEFID